MATQIAARQTDEKRGQPGESGFSQEAGKSFANLEAHDYFILSPVHDAKSTGCDEVYWLGFDHTTS